MTTKTIKINGNTKTAKNKAVKEMEKFIKELKAQKTLGIAKDESSMKFSEYADIVFKIRDRKASFQTKINRKYYLVVVKKYFGNIKLKDITATKIENFFTEMSETKSDQVLSKYK
ncbi:hypothetical protein KHQ81_06235 [Mycoplasmatota bacterium]|nr:hypothetical protein KHQ81_06235 [Mycoplasmatota bacterium]